MSSDVNFNLSDVCDGTDFVSVVGSFPLRNVLRASIFAGDAFRVGGDLELAARVDGAADFISIGYAWLDAWSLIGSLKDRKISKIPYHACSFLSSLTSALKFFETSARKIALIGRLSPFVPVCDTIVHVKDIYDGVQDLREAPKVGSEVELEFQRLQRQEKKVLLSKSVVLGSATILCAAGILSSPLALLSVSLTCFAIAAKGFQANLQLREYAMMQRAITFTNN